MIAYPTKCKARDHKGPSYFHLRSAHSPNNDKQNATECRTSFLCASAARRNKRCGDFTRGHMHVCKACACRPAMRLVPFYLAHACPSRSIHPRTTSGVYVKSTLLAPSSPVQPQRGCLHRAFPNRSSHNSTSSQQLAYQPYLDESNRYPTAISGEQHEAQQLLRRAQCNHATLLSRRPQAASREFESSAPHLYTHSTNTYMDSRFRSCCARMEDFEKDPKRGACLV